MKTVVDKVTGKVLYCRYDEVTEPNEVAIDLLCTIESESESEIYYNFETKEFYLK